MKKRNILFATVLFFALGFLPACDLLEECGTCKLITDDGSGNITEGTPIPLCGDALAERENQAPVTVGNITTYYECY